MAQALGQKIPTCTNVFGEGPKYGPDSRIYKTFKAPAVSIARCGSQFGNPEDEASQYIGRRVLLGDW